MDVLTVGGATIDAFLQIEKESDVIRFDSTQGELRIKAGEKIEMDTCTFSVGGNACNVAVGLSRLGFSAGVCAEIGTDDFALKILQNLHDERVKTDFVLQTPHTVSSFAMALNIGSERTLFIQHKKREHHFDLSKLSTTWMYLTSIGETWEAAYQMIETVVKEKHIQLVYSPGTLQLKEYHDEVKALFPLTKVLCLNTSEASRVVKLYLGKEASEPKALLTMLKSLGPQIISMTDGAKGAYALDIEDTMWFVPNLPDPVVERTGAGDAYATGFISALMAGNSVTDAMRYGTMNATSVIGTIGAQQGLLTKHDMEKRLADNLAFQPTEV